MTCRPLLARSAKIAVVVGTVLLAINHGDTLARGYWRADLLWKAPLTYLVPFLVALARYREGLGWGAAYGVGWWVLGGLVLMAVFLDMPAFAPLTMPPMRPVAFNSFMGHLMYGLVLGAVHVRLAGQHTEARTEQRTRAA